MAGVTPGLVTGPNTEVFLNQPRALALRCWSLFSTMLLLSVLYDTVALLWLSTLLLPSAAALVLIGN